LFNDAHVNDLTDEQQVTYYILRGDWQSRDFRVKLVLNNKLLRFLISDEDAIIRQIAQNKLAEELYKKVGEL